MTACHACGSENPDGFRFCGRCGADLETDAAPGVRKTVTVLFCDLVGSTALGERSDPEVLREIMVGYHAELRARILARRGRLDEAEEVIRSALELGPQAAVAYGTNAQLALAEVLARAGRTGEARVAAEDALSRFEAKGVVPLVRRTQALLASLPT